MTRRSARPTRGRDIFADLRWGLAPALRLGGLFAGLALLAALARGTTDLGAGRGSAWAAVAVSLGAGLACGLALGLGRPLARTRAGALTLGALVGTVAYACFLRGAAGGPWATLEASAALGVPSGVLGAAYFRWRSRAWAARRPR